MRRYRYRVRVFNDPRGPWRETPGAAKDDAIRLGLAAYDESRREWYLPVPASIERRELVSLP
jgi:hypothetical protein